MGILDRAAAYLLQPTGSEQAATQEAVELRMVPDDALDIGQHRAQKPRGITDSRRPRTEQIDGNYRGLFSAIVRMRSDAIGSAMQMAQVKRYNRAGDLEPVEAVHPWVTLLRRPNTNRAALEVFRWLSISRDMSGASDFIVERNAIGLPIALHEIFPVFGILRPQADGLGGIGGWIFDRADGKTIPLEADDVVRVRHPDPVSAYQTSSLMERLRYELDQITYGDIYDRDELKDGRRPPLMLTTSQSLTRDQLATARDLFKAAYQTTGGGEVHGIPILGNDLKPTGTSVSPELLQRIEQRKLTDTHVFWTTGLPQGLLSDQANRANAEAAEQIFAKWTIQPEVDAICAQLTVELERIFKADPGVLEIEAPNVIPVDEDTRSKIDERRLRSRLTTVNEVRARDGEEPVDWGNEPAQAVTAF